MIPGIANTGSTRWSGSTKRFETNNMEEGPNPETKTITQIRPFPFRREIGKSRQKMSSEKKKMVNKTFFPSNLTLPNHIHNHARVCGDE